MNEQAKPRLMQLSDDGQANKPEGLEGHTITITQQIDVRTSDGRDSAQWMVRLNDGSTGLYWAAGKGPMLAVRQWFLDNPKTPLHCSVWRTVSEWGNNIWKIRQIDDDPAAGAAADAASRDAQLDDAGL